MLADIKKRLANRIFYGGYIQRQAATFVIERVKTPLSVRCR